jgi:predicted kinase
MSGMDWKTNLKERKSAVIFTGLQASGKSAFYTEYFSGTHVRINLDELHTRSKEKRLLEECITEGRSLVIDNTNPKAEDRARYIIPVKAAGYQITGIYFRSTVKECMERNALREGKARVPDVAILATAAKLERPDTSEGFDELYYVSIEGEGFKVEKELSTET